MPIDLGTKDIPDIYIGTTEMKEVRLGEVLKWANNQTILVGSGTSFNIANVYSGYKKLSAGNFFFRTFNGTSASDRVTVAGSYEYVSISGGMIKSYNASTGSLQMYSAMGSSIDLTKGNKGAVSLVIVTKPSKLISLGTGSSFNVKAKRPDDYQTFTADNFIFSYVPDDGRTNYLFHESRTYDGTWTASGSGSFVKTYNTSTGILTAYWHTSGTSDTGSWTKDRGVTAYLTLKRPE